MFKIGEFSRLSNITIRMLRHYDEIGLIVPEYTDRFTGYRYYNATQLIVAGKVQLYKSLGFSLESIIKILKNENDKQFIEDYFKVREIELSEQKTALNRQMTMFYNMLERVERNMENIKYTAVQKNIPARVVASYRGIIPAYNAEGMLWGVLMEEVAEQNIKQTANPLTCAIFHDQEYKESNVDVEVCIDVEGQPREADTIKVYLMPSKDVVSVTFKGSYDQTNAVTQVIAQYIEDNKLEMDGPMFNIYHISPYETSNPDEFVTESCYVIKSN